MLPEGPLGHGDSAGAADFTPQPPPPLPPPLPSAPGSEPPAGPGIIQRRESSQAAHEADGRSSGATKSSGDQPGGRDGHEHVSFATAADYMHEDDEEEEEQEHPPHDNPPPLELRRCVFLTMHHPNFR